MRIFIHFIIIALVSFTQIGNVKAQKNQKGKQIEAIRMGFLSGRLNLTSLEADTFWPMYKEYQSGLNQIFAQKRRSRLQNTDNPDKVIDEGLYYDGKLLEFRKEYRKSFGKILPPEKLKNLYAAERDFREELVKQLKNRPPKN